MVLYHGSHNKLIHLVWSQDFSISLSVPWEEVQSVIGKDSYWTLYPLFSPLDVILSRCSNPLILCNKIPPILQDWHNSFQLPPLINWAYTTRLSFLWQTSNPDTHWIQVINQSTNSFNPDFVSHVWGRNRHIIPSISCVLPPSRRLYLSTRSLVLLISVKRIQRRYDLKG